MEREAPAPAPRSAQHQAEPAYSVRQRPPAPGLHLHAHSSAPPNSSVQSQLPHVRDRITFPSAPSQASLEHDWDIPTFQRRGSGG
jgi:hypothetical protein